jgi:predicted small lipoprotein YifL
MNITKRAWLALALISFTIGLSACGQKGPLKVERPQVIQEQEQEETQ